MRTDVHCRAIRRVALLAACSILLKSALLLGQDDVDSKLRAESAQLDVFEAALKQQPGDATARKGEIEAAVSAALDAKRAGHDERALSFLLRAKYWVPDDPELLLDTGVQEESMKLYKDADAALAEARRLRPGDTKTLYAIARVKMDLTQTQASEEAWCAYLEERPDDASAHYGYGTLLQMLQRTDAARAQFQKSIELSPQQVESYYRLGEIAREGGDALQAKKYYKEALSHGPSHAGALTGLAILAYQAHRYDEAEGELAQAIAYAPDFQTARYYHGLTLAKLGRKQESEQELAVAVQIANSENARKDQTKQLAAQPYKPQ
jgi:tetratricopeptide (TPR) repeat protein